MKSPATGRPGFRPRLEALEERWAPAVRAVQVGNTLAITGDVGGVVTDSVTISLASQVGSAAVGSAALASSYYPPKPVPPPFPNPPPVVSPPVIMPARFSVSGTGLPTTFFNGITNITIDLGRGGSQVITVNGTANGTSVLAGFLRITDANPDFPGRKLTVNINNNVTIRGLLSIVAARAQGTLTDNPNLRPPTPFFPGSFSALVVNLGRAGGGATTLANVLINGPNNSSIVNVADVTMGYLSANFISGPNQLNIVSSTLTGFLSYVNTGTGSDAITFIDSTVRGNTAIVTGQGADTATLGNTLNAQEVFGGRVTVDLGSENDILRVLGTFNSSASFMGGTGFNTLALAFATFNAGPPTIVNFQSITT